jgi:putative ABC transport system permease protein
MGIRMALGATAGEIRRMVLRQSGNLILAGLALGTAGTLAVVTLTPVLGDQIYGVKRNDPLTLIAMATLLAGAALAASYVPAQRATRVDPMMAPQRVT